MAKKRSRSRASQAVTVSAGPTKKFFVDMLTRDIDLEDAIIDLLDNCIDGILRQSRGKTRSKKPYDGFWAKIVATPEVFSIEDNCGGISVELARNSAFMLGRPDSRDNDIETVGMYGIGMKRAIFKMGRNCRVVSQASSGTFSVSIKPKWFEEDDNWTLPMKQIDAELEENGTKIEISELLPVMKTKFDPEKSKFLDDLFRQISELFALIIDKGFSVTLNDQVIPGVSVDVLSPIVRNASKKKGVAPYVFKGTVEGVSVDLVVGFYRPLASEEELDSESRSSRKHSGWTVVCNDRIVLYGDKTRLTGWGTAQVPAYHNQFIAIRGVVVFKSKNSFLLPMNTTKRGLDASSSVYLYVLDIMREGTKQFTTYTNRWKTRTKETTPDFDKLEKKNTESIISSIPDKQWTSVRKGSGTNVKAKKFVPDLPMPPRTSSNARIAFSRPISEVDEIALYWFGETGSSASEIGEQCFDAILSEARE